MRCGCRGDSWISVCFTLFAACAGPTAGSSPERLAVHAEPPRTRSELVEAARGWPPASAPFVSRGHGDGSYVIDIRISPASLEAVRNLVLGGTVPVGTVAVAFHTRARSKASESAFAMRKLDEGKWEFVVADSAGNVVSAGPQPLCAQCHADAPADFLFVPDSIAATSPPGGSGGSVARDGG